MKKQLLFLPLLLINLAFAAPIQDRCIDLKSLLELTQALDIPIETDIIAETQKHWLRKHGQERWELEELSPDQKEIVIDWAEKECIFDSWRPAWTNYNKAIILGATTCRMQMRLEYLKELWALGVRFDEVIWLTGERELDSRVDALTDRCQTESAAAHILWEEADLPEEMRHLPVVFIAVPIKCDGKRPNTEDTIIAWLKTTDSFNSALFVSNQPFCGYQFAVLKTCLPAALQFDVVGPGFDTNSHPAAAALLLDSIARWLYQDNSNKKQ